MNPDDLIYGHELNAFLDGELDEEARGRVERYLASQPMAAARMMEEVATARALRSSLCEEDIEASVVALSGDAQRLQDGLVRARRTRLSMRIAATIAVFACGWMAAGVQAPGVTGSPPAFVNEAMSSHQTALLRARIVSQPETPRYDPAELRAATRIVLPAMPADWRVTDAQVYPSDEGPSISLSFVTPDGPVSLFAFHTADAGSIAPTTVRRDGGNVSYWQGRGMAYALIGAGQADVVDRMAEQLARSTPLSAAS